MLFPKFAAVLAAFAVAGASAQKCKCPSNPCTTDLVINGDFDDPLDGSPWVFTGVGLTKNLPRSQPQAASDYITGIGQRDKMQQTVAWTAGKTYTLRYYWAIAGGVLANNEGCVISVSVDGFVTEDANFLVSPLPAGTYNLREYTFTAPATNSLQFQFACVTEANGLRINVDDVSIYDAACLTIPTS